MEAHGDSKPEEPASNGDDPLDGSAMNVTADPVASRVPAEPALRTMIVLLCAPSGIGLLLKAYGLMELRAFFFAIAVPCLALLGIAVWKSSADLRSDIVIGGVSGLIGTVAYDIVRIPAEVVGYRVYGTISVFGLWLLDAQRSTRFTELAGWSYNYLNGACFGMMYAVAMRGRHWLFGIAWAMVLESLAILTPFGRIFNVRGNVTIMVIAYAAHIAYGLPLGKAVQNWRDTRSALRDMPIAARWATAVIALVVLFHSLLMPSAAAADARATAGVFRVEGIAMNPGWLRIRSGDSVTISNATDQPVSVTIKDLHQTIVVASGNAQRTAALPPGIHQFFVETTGRTHSSFVAVEPVESGR